MIDVGRPGGAGVTVAVLDTGIAYSDRGRCPRSAESNSRRTVTCRRSPDFRTGDFVAGYDFVDDDSRPNDENGHGTHVSGTIGEGTERQRRRDRPGLRRADHAGARARPARGGRQRRDLGRHPLRRPQRRRRDQPLVRVRHPGDARRDPRHPRRAALRPPQGRARGRRLRQRRRPQRRLSRARLAGAVGRRHDPARLRRRVLQQRRQPRHRRPRRRRGRPRPRRPELPARRDGPAATSSR